MTHYLTPERLEELKQELQELKTVKRAEVADRLKRAKELGDLSENVEYQEAREEQGQVEARIYELDEMLKNASVIQPTGKQDQVRLGSTVVAERNGQEMKFRIVGSNETKPEAGQISNESPLGTAFLGHKSGDTIKVKTASGETEYKIVRIE
jgi:transcription elongation factor GreA